MKRGGLMIKSWGFRLWLLIDQLFMLPKNTPLKEDKNGPDVCLLLHRNNTSEKKHKCDLNLKPQLILFGIKYMLMHIKHMDNTDNGEKKPTPNILWVKLHPSKSLMSLFSSTESQTKQNPSSIAV